MSKKLKEIAPKAFIAAICLSLAITEELYPRVYTFAFFLFVFLIMLILSFLISFIKNRGLSVKLLLKIPVYAFYLSGIAMCASCPILTGLVPFVLILLAAWVPATLLCLLADRIWDRCRD